MKQLTLLLTIVACSIASVHAQKYYTKNARVTFFSKATLENIKADNNQVTSTLNTATGELNFSLLTNAFHFEKALMEEHFNDNYIESAKYPRATLKARSAISTG